VFRILRLYRLFTAGKKDNELQAFDKAEIRKKTIIIITTTLAMIFIATGILHSSNDLDFL
jgi:hypothetical protein